MSKYQDDPMVKKFKNIISLGQVWVYAGKKRIL